MSKQNSESTLDCPCGFGKNIGVNQSVCPVCGTDLTPLHRLRSLPRLYYERGLRCSQQGDKDQARSSFRIALALRPGFIEAREELQRLEVLESKPPLAMKSVLTLAAGVMLGIRLFAGRRRDRREGKRRKK